MSDITIRYFPGKTRHLSSLLLASASAKCDFSRDVIRSAQLLLCLTDSFEKFFTGIPDISSSGTMWGRRDICCHEQLSIHFLAQATSPLNTFWEIHDDFFLSLGSRLPQNVVAVWHWFIAICGICAAKRVAIRFVLQMRTSSCSLRNSCVKFYL